jgi:hypothetical protein
VSGGGNKVLSCLTIRGSTQRSTLHGLPWDATKLSSKPTLRQRHRLRGHTGQRAAGVVVQGGTVFRLQAADSTLPPARPPTQTSRPAKPTHPLSTAFPQVCGGPAAVEAECRKTPKCVAFDFETGGDNKDCGYLKSAPGPTAVKEGFAAFQRPDVTTLPGAAGAVELPVKPPPPSPPPPSPPPPSPPPPSPPPPSPSPPPPVEPEVVKVEEPPPPPVGPPRYVEAAGVAITGALLRDVVCARLWKRWWGLALFPCQD